MSKDQDTFGIVVGVGFAALALACVPRVSAAIVVTEPDPEPEPEPESGPAESAKNARGDRLPPELVRAEHISLGHLRLHFSEPMVVDGSFDPNDFRLSVLNISEYETPPENGVYHSNYGRGYNEGYSNGTYSDFGYSYYGTRLEFQRWQQAGTELNLYFTPELNPYACRQISNTYGHYNPPGVSYENGLFLHYAAGAIPLRDEQGYPLANFGADWVLRGRSEEGLNYRSLEPDEISSAGRNLIEVHCEAVLPPGPR